MDQGLAEFKKLVDDMSKTAAGYHTQQPQKSDGQVGGKGSEKTSTSAVIKDSDAASKEAPGTKKRKNGRNKKKDKKAGRSQGDLPAVQKRVPEEPQLKEGDVPCSIEFVVAKAEAGNLACAKDVVCKPGNQKESTTESARKDVEGQNKGVVGKKLKASKCIQTSENLDELATAQDDAENSSLPPGSDVVFDNVCQPCKNDGKILKAEGRCVDCDEFLCKRCFLSHTIPSITRNHVMVGNDQLRQGSISEEMDHCTQPCPQHSDETLKYYCLEHKFIGCSVCIIFDHKSCTETLYIPNIAKCITSSDVYTRYKASKMTVETKTRAIATHIKTQIDTVNRYQAAVVEQMKTFKGECVAMLERTEKENVKESKRIQNAELDKQKKTLDKINPAASKDIKDIIFQIEGFESKKQYCNMFMAMIKAQDELKSCEDRLSEIDLRGELPRKLFFNPNPCLNEWIAADGIGRIVESPVEVKGLKHERDIHVKTQSDANICWISGSAILPGNRLIIADCSNNKLKVIDFQQDKVVEELKMSSQPWTVAATRPGHVAATLPDESKIALVETDGKLVHNGMISVDGECRGVAYSDNKLVVLSGKPCKVELMDMEGHVLKTIATNTSEKKLMYEPFFVAINSVAIYVTDIKLRMVFGLRSNGQLATVLTDEYFKEPMGMVIDGLGMLYVCDWRNNNVHQITMHGTNDRILLTENDVMKPYSISYSDIKNKFYIGMRDSDIVKVFKAVY